MRPSRNPRAAQETPKDLQNAMQKNAQKIPINASVVKNALSRRSHVALMLDPTLAPQICTFFNHLLHIFYHFLETCWNLFWSPFWDQSGPRGPRWAQKSHHKLQRTKTFIFKNLKKNNWFFEGFWLQRPLKKASRGRRRLPKGTQKIQDPKK